MKDKNKTRANKQKQRRCISSGEVCDKSDMIRFIVGPNNEVIPDISEKLPGRGIWVKSNRSFLEKALSKKLFIKSAKYKVSVRHDLINLVEAILLNDTLEPALRAELIKLPSENDLAQAMVVIDVDNIHFARRYIQQHIGQEIKEKLQNTYKLLRFQRPKIDSLMLYIFISDSL